MSLRTRHSRATQTRPQTQTGGPCQTEAPTGQTLAPCKHLRWGPGHTCHRANVAARLTYVRRRLPYRRLHTTGVPTYPAIVYSGRTVCSMGRSRSQMLTHPPERRTNLDRASGVCQCTRGGKPHCELRSLQQGACCDDRLETSPTVRTCIEQGGFSSVLPTRLGFSIAQRRGGPNAHATPSS